MEEKSKFPTQPFCQLILSVNAAFLVNTHFFVMTMYFIRNFLDVL